MAERDPSTNGLGPNPLGAGDLESNYLEAVSAQAKASDPARTRFVSANAGSGKTHVLVGRVSRLLLDGAEPDRILCLTYTKAAAAEMQARLFATLGKWSVLDDEGLHTELRTLTGAPYKGDLAAARGLFAKALETPEGLKVQTIHAFCAQVLKRFPMEAGILPGFDQIDDGGEARLKADVRRQLLHAAWYQPRSQLADHIRELARENADQTLDELFTWMGGKTREIELFTTEDGLREIAGMLGIGAQACPREEARRAWAATCRRTLRELAEVLDGASQPTARDQADRIRHALEASAHCEVTAWERYMEVFHTGGGGWRASIVPKAAPEAAKAFFGYQPKRGEPSLETEETQRVRAAIQAIRAAELLGKSRRINRVADAYARTYRDVKRERRTLDFNDQIHLVHDLLDRSEAADWVRYKLDAGIEHILVDEAQDTSELQWKIIHALGEEFASTRAEDGTQGKTFFAVGDEKQSIYGFQGASPATFAKEIDEADAEDVVRMSMSFRSAPAILEAVDAVFSDHDAGTRMFEGDLAAGRHTARRSDAGRVEIWPIVPNPEGDEDEVAWDPRPVDAKGASHPKEQLARKLATTIRGWIESGEPVFDRDRGVTRAMEAGDVFILVQKRDAFFDAMIRNLKAAGVPVAGADRLVLAEATVVKDLMALARWALFPRDDLSLAEVLRSPIGGLSEDELFHLAHGRPGTLWEAVQASAHGGVRDLLERVMASVLELAPYEFFVTALDRVVDGTSLRLAIERRMGVEARDPLQEFLGQVLAFQRRTSASLQHFVQEWDGSEFELKREPDGRASEVRIMTVHGSKGLQAPVVILPQTTAAPKTGKAGELLEIEAGGERIFVPRPKSGQEPPALVPWIEAADARARQEHLRLLYVAMTRAESRLLVCGYPKASNAKPDKYADELSWYEEVRKGFEHLRAEAFETDWGEGLAHGGEPEPPARTGQGAEGTPAALPRWVSELVEGEHRASGRRVTPSHLLDDGRLQAVRSPLTRTAQAERQRRFLRGNLIHKLLEVLPDIAPERREEVAGRILERHGLNEATRAAILGEAMRVLTDFPDLFVPGSRAEVSLAGMAEGLGDVRLNAQIDRINVRPDRVHIIDYKSNRPPPERVEDVSAAYLAQMAAYRELAREIWDRPVTCALLWTDAARLMELPEEALDAALVEVRGRLA